MKYLILSVSVFAAFFSSCNVFTLSGAKTSIGFNNFIEPSAALPPIVTSGEMLGGSCDPGDQVIIFGSGFTHDMQVRFFELNSATYTTPGNIISNTNTEATLELPSDIITGKIGIYVTGPRGESKMYGFYCDI